MKNNKGFTLVELLVAMAVLSIVMIEVFNVMSNSAKLYIKGTSEIGLQAEAQQVILQLEDLLVDCTGVVAPDHELADAETFTISSNSVNYIVNYVRNPADEYGQLQLTVPDAANIPLSDYVNSISVNMSNYDTNNIVTLSISMNNGTYSYETTQDVFLRNMPGTGVGKRGTPAAANGSIQLDVARYHTYQLKNECVEDIALFEADHGSNYNYIFEWDSACKNVMDSDSRTVASYYDLGESSGELETKALVNSTFNKEYGYEVEYTINCYADDKSTPVVERTPVTNIQISTVKVEVGLGSAGTNSYSPYGYGLMFPWSADSSAYFSAISVRGIDISACDSLDFEVDVVYPRNSSAAYRVNYTNGSLSPLLVGSTGLTDAQKYNVTPTQLTIGTLATENGGKFNDISGVQNDSIWVDQSGITCDEYGTCILVHTSRMLHADKYCNLIKAGYIIELHCSANYSGPNNVLNFSIYSMPIDDKEHPISDISDVQNMASELISKIR